MTLEEFEKKWPETMSREELSDEQKRELIADAFKMYEETGFSETFKSPYEQYKKYNGMKYKVVAQRTEETEDFEYLPSWTIKFENGDTIMALPEEICKIEVKN